MSTFAPNERFRSRRLWLVLLPVMGLTSCGQGYAERNEAAADPILQADFLDITGAPTNESYCRQDSCWFGDDGTLTLYNFTLKIPPQDLESSLSGALPDWEVNEVSCGSEESDCENDNVVVALSDDAIVHLAFDDQGDGIMKVDTGLGSP